MQNSTKIKIKDNPLLKLLSRIGKLKIGRVGLAELLIILGLVFLAFRLL